MASGNHASGFQMCPSPGAQGTLEFCHWQLVALAKWYAKVFEFLGPGMIRLVNCRSARQMAFTETRMTYCR